MNRLNPVAWLLILLVKGYQVCISPWLPPCCRYVPTCSQYMIESIRRRGVIVGTAKGILRVLKCNPFFPGGYDPVK